MERDLAARRIYLANRTLAASAYFFGIPALYLVLTERRKKPFIGEHSARALLLWTGYFLFFFVLRSGVNWLGARWPFPGLDYVEFFLILFGYLYLFWQGVLCYRGRWVKK
jgi:hypothetical protein